MEKEVFLSVVIPAYNEEHRLGTTLEALDVYLKNQPITYEVVVVSDGSHDRTGEMVKDRARTMQGLVLIDNKDNHGKGYVVRQGMLAARGKFRLFMDSDYSVSIKYIETFLPYFSQGYDVVIASIELPGAKIEEHAAWYRRALRALRKAAHPPACYLEIRHPARVPYFQRAAQDVFSLTLTRWGLISRCWWAPKARLPHQELPWCGRIKNQKSV
jgi:glycosyltransferase involved in cell wall biosynthesis